MAFDTKAARQNTEARCPFRCDASGNGCGYLSERTFVERDLCLYPKRILPEDVKGRDVMLAVEVAGSSISYDRGLKARIYAGHGVGELWVIDAETRATWVHRRPDGEGQWGSIEKMGADTPVSPTALPAVAVRMADLD